MKREDKNNEIKISDSEKELLREIIKNERSSISVFPLPSKQEQKKYEKILHRLDNEFA